MVMVPFDTLKLARDLEHAGLSQSVAAGASAALADALIGADLATKADLLALEARQDAKLTAAIGALDVKLTAAIGALDQKLTGAIGAVEAKLELLRRDMTIKLGGMMFIAVGVILTALRLMPHP